MSKSFREKLRRSQPKDIEAATDLTIEEAEIVYLTHRDFSDGEIAEQISEDVEEMKSTKEQIQAKGYRAQVTLRTLRESGSYEPNDISIDFLEDGESMSEEIVTYFGDLIENEENLLEELDDHRRELNKLARLRRDRLRKLKAVFGDERLLDIDPWEVMDRGEQRAYVLETIDQITAETGDAAPASAIFEKLEDHINAPPNDVEEILENMRMRGRDLRDCGRAVSNLVNPMVGSSRRR